MQQVTNFNPANGGTTRYLCLKNVRLGYGIASKHQFATEDWNNNIQHRDRNYPAGCSVPVYWSWFGTVDGVYKDWGHIAVRLADGRIWTDGRYYADVDTLNANYLGGKGKYLGWGEMVNKVRIVKESEVSMAETINDDTSRQWGYHILGRNGYDGRPNALQAPQQDLIGKPLTNATSSSTFLSAEAREYRDVYTPKLYQERDSLRNQVKTIQSEVTRLSNSNQELTNTVVRQNGEIIGLTQTVNEKKQEIEVLQDEVIDLKKQLANCGKPTNPEDEVTITKDNLWTSFKNLVNSILKK